MGKPALSAFEGRKDNSAIPEHTFLPRQHIPPPALYGPHRCPFCEFIAMFLPEAGGARGIQFVTSLNFSRELSFSVLSLQ